MTQTTDKKTQAPAEITALYRQFGDPKALAESMEWSASYLENCASKHGPSPYYSRSIETCRRISRDLHSLKERNPALVRYRNVLYSLDEAQIDAFAGIIIDYQARIGGEFVPVSTNQYLADLTAMAFALAAIDEPTCMGGVGMGLGPRYKWRVAA